MNLHNNFGVLVLIRLCFLRDVIVIDGSDIAATGFLVYRTMSITQRSCNCSMSFSCSCCQNVIILYTKKEKNLCVNFTYQRNGFNVDVALNSDIISTRTVTTYKTFQFCVFVPGCLFSTACVNILELSRFPNSIMACLRLDIYAKKQLWQVNYDCVNMSTELPTMSTDIAPRMTNMRSEETILMESTTAMITNQMMTMGMSGASSAGTTEMTEQTGEMTEMPGVSSEQTEQMTVD